MRYICVLAVVLFMFGCGRKAGEKAAERQIEKGLQESSGGDAKVDIDGDSISIETEDGAMQMSSGKQAKIPEAFPKDVFVHGDIQVAMTVPQGFSLVLQTKDTQDKVAEIYSKKMQAAGWSREMSADMGGQKMSIFKKEDRTVSLVTTAVDGNTQIALTVATE